MGKKVFINGTGHSLAVQLQVRKGDQPGNTAAIKDFSLSNGQKEMVVYSGDANPYLDGISVNAVDGDQVVAEQQFVFTRGGSLDNEFNMHDTVKFDMSNQSLVVSFSNTWTV